MTITRPVGRCARCRGGHASVSYRQMLRPIPDVDGEFTHWGTCPATGDPILMRVTADGARMPTGRIIVLPQILPADGDDADAWRYLTLEETRRFVRRKPSTVLPVGDNEQPWVAFDGVKL